jgi:hypothetical protein
MLMTNRHIVGAVIMLVVGLVAPNSARAQVLPSPPWGEPIQAPSRFVVLASFNNEAVYDQETGLVWEQAPTNLARSWYLAQADCNSRAVGNRKGWRLPTIQELASLIDPTVPSPNPTLPVGHPFVNVHTPSPTGDALYWSATTLDPSSTVAWVVEFGAGGVGNTDKSRDGAAYHWCVRGGQGVNPQ